MTTQCITPFPNNIFTLYPGKNIINYIKDTFLPLQRLVSIGKGDYLGPYKLIRHIDGGTYGDVWEAIDTRPIIPPPLVPLPPQKVAIKIQCNSSDSDNECYISAFRELECLYQLGGIENIVQLLDAFYINSTLFFVLEYCEQTLHDLFKTMKYTSINDLSIKLIFKQILQGLAEINRRGYIHFDIKPKNILIDSTGTVKICDFSISYKISEIKMGEEYQTTWYRAPEAVNNHLHGEYFKSTFNIGYNVDVWSIGCILYEGMTKGEVLFRCEDSNMLFKTLNKNRFYDKEDQYINRKLSQYPLFIDFIKTCLTYDNTERLTAEQLLSHEFFI
jgi:serine/threonine protein kinase